MHEQNKVQYLLASSWAVGVKTLIYEKRIWTGSFILPLKAIKWPIISAKVFRNYDDKFVVAAFPPFLPYEHNIELSLNILHKNII